MLRKYGLGILIASLLGGFSFTYVFYSQTGDLPFRSATLVFFFISIVLANTNALAVHKINGWLNKIISWKKNTSLRLLAGLLVHTVVSLLIIYSFSWLLISWLTPISGLDIFNAFREPAIQIGIIVFISVLIYSVIYFAFFSYHQFTVGQIETVKHERKQIKLQFDALKSQLSPHYLFNCLNTVSSLVYKDADQAESFIRRLAQTYQYILRTHKLRLVTLKEEVDFVKSYYFLLKVRYQNSFDLTIDIPSEYLGSVIPPLTLQILVENAVKHNLFSKENPLEVFINVEDDYLKVTNTKTERPAQVSSFKVGLDNIRNRYDFFTTRSIKVEDGNEFKVMVPVLEQEISPLPVDSRVA